MRALVLVLLGGSLLWFVLRNFGSTQAEGPEESVAPRGFLLPPAESEHSALMASPGTVDPLEGQGETAPAVSSDLVAPAASPSKPTAEAVPTGDSKPAAESESIARREGSSGTAEDELALASQLLHHPREVSESLRTHPSSVSPERRDLVLAFAAAIQGDLVEARRLGQGLEGKTNIAASERDLLTRVLDREAGRPVLASVSRETPLAQAATMALLAKEGDSALQRGHARDAARVFSELLLEEIRAPWKSDQATLRAWTESLRRAQAGYRWNRSGEWPAIEVTVEKGDSLISIRKRVLKDHPELLLCTGLIERANGLRGGVVHPGQVLRIPTERAHMLVALDAHWTLYLLGGEVAGAWEVGVGKAGSETRAGNYYVGEKSTEPMWFRPGHKPVPFGDPENPLGTRWISWRAPDGTASGLGFHGTKEPGSIGQDLSQGCVRMLNQDVEELYEILPKDAAIVVQP